MKTRDPVVSAGAARVARFFDIVNGFLKSMPWCIGAIFVIVFDVTLINLAEIKLSACRVGAGFIQGCHWWCGLSSVR